MTTTVTGVGILVILMLITLFLIEGIVMFVGSLVGWDSNYVYDRILSYFLWVTMGLSLIGCVVLLFLLIISIIIGYVI